MGCPASRAEVSPSSMRAAARAVWRSGWQVWATRSSCATHRGRCWTEPESISAEANLSNCVTTVHSSIQDLKCSIDGGFDVVACHAVLEWLADPKTALGCLVELLKPGGGLSLMFYNRNAVLLKQVFSGEFVEALRERREEYSSRGWGDGATPLAEETVHEWLDEYGLAVGSRSGIRIFHDHLPEDARSRGRLDGLLEVERELRKQEPFASLGQHICLICERSW